MCHFQLPLLSEAEDSKVTKGSSCSQGAHRRVHRSLQQDMKWAAGERSEHRGGRGQLQLHQGLEGEAQTMRAGGKGQEVGKGLEERNCKQ